MTESIDPRAQHREHIQQRTEFVRGKRGPVSFVWGNHVANPGQHVPGAPGLWSPLPEGEAGLQVEASAKDGIVIGGETVDGAAKLMADPNHPASIAYFPNGSEGVIFSYDNKRFALQVWNPKSAWAQQFSHIQAFDWSADWIVEARIEAVTDGRTVAVAHHRNPIPVDRPVVAKMTFDIDGVEQTLYATRYADKYNFHFTDATSGHKSYGSGRSVRIPADQSGAVSIDFNFAALLPCSFSRAWNCPIPPLENRLRVPIAAGERFAVDTMACRCSSDDSSRPFLPRAHADRASQMPAFAFANLRLSTARSSPGIRFSSYLTFRNNEVRSCRTNGTLEAADVFRATASSARRNW